MKELCPHCGQNIKPAGRAEFIRLLRERFGREWFVRGDADAIFPKVKYGTYDRLKSASNAGFLERKVLGWNRVEYRLSDNIENTKALNARLESERLARIMGVDGPICAK